MLHVTILEFQGKAEDDGVLKAPRIQAAEAVDPVELILHRVFVKKKRLARVGKRLVFLKINAEQGEVVRVERGEDALAECALCPGRNGCQQDLQRQVVKAHAQYVCPQNQLPPIGSYP